MRTISKSLKKMVHLYSYPAYDENPPERVDPKQWREDWDDEDINDDFVGQLKKELNAWSCVNAISYNSNLNFVPYSLLLYFIFIPPISQNNNICTYII